MLSLAQCTISDPFYPLLWGRQQAQQHPIIPLVLNLALTHQIPLATHRPPSFPSVSLGSEGEHNTRPTITYTHIDESSLPLELSGSWTRGSRRLGWFQNCPQALGL